MKTHPLRLFISYAHKDDQFRQELETHLKPLQRQGIVEIWSDRAIEAGQEWEKSISEQLETAEIILLLVSSDFLASEYIYDKELKRAMERHTASQARVIPVFLRPCNWEGAPFGKLQGVPDNAKPISQWRNRDEAFTHVAEAIRKAAGSLRSSEPNLSPEPQPVVLSAGGLRKLILPMFTEGSGSSVMGLIAAVAGIGVIIGMVLWLWGKPQPTITTHGAQSPVVTGTDGDVTLTIGPPPPSQGRP